MTRLSLKDLLSKFHNDNADDVFIYDQDGNYLDCGLACSSAWLDDEVLDISLRTNKIIVIVRDD